MAFQQLLRRDPSQSIADRAPFSGVSAAAGKSPLERALEAAPIDDEPITDNEEKAVQEAGVDTLAGQIVSHEMVRQRLGLPLLNGPPKLRRT